MTRTTSSEMIRLFDNSLERRLRAKGTRTPVCWVYTFGLSLNLTSPQISMTSPEIFIAAQPQTTQRTLLQPAVLLTHDRSPSATPVPNGHVDWNFPPAFPIANYILAAVKSPARWWPE